MLATHFGLLQNNLTTNESINQWRYTYLSTNEMSGDVINPFDRGSLFRNARQVLKDRDRDTVDAVREVENLWARHSGMHRGGATVV